MTVLSLDEYRRDRDAQPELVWTCDAEGNWRQERRTRTREGNGYRETIIPTEEVGNGR